MNPNSFIIKTGKQLDNDLRAIGFNLSCEKKSTDPNIEISLVSASVETINNQDNRLGGLLVDWITIHSLRINVDRLTKFVFNLSDSEHKFVKIFWCANAQRLFPKDQRFQRLSKLYKGKRINFANLTKILIEIKGEDERFKRTCIRIPKGYFPERLKQIFSGSIVAKNHLPYRYRLMMGPSYRADLWALLKRYPTLSAYSLGKKAYCSYRTAYIAKKDYELLNMKL